MKANLCMMTKGSKELLSCKQEENNATYINLIPECHGETWCKHPKLNLTAKCSRGHREQVGHADPPVTLRNT